MFNVPTVGIGKTIKALRQARGWTLERLEQESGVAVGTISALETRDSSRSQYFPPLAKALGVTVEDLPRLGDLPAETLKSALETKTYGTSPERLTPDEDTPRAAELKRHEGLAPILAWEHEDDLPPGEFVMVPRLDVHLSAGGGRDQVEIELVKGSPQAFRTSWIRDMRLKPNKLAAMTASGDSMEPTIHHGDSLLIDVSQVDVVDGKVYALWYDGGERVKRLFRLPGGGLRIKSDNPAFDTIELPPGYSGYVRVLGRVVHRSGTGGL